MNISIPFKSFLQPLGNPSPSDPLSSLGFLSPFISVIDMLSVTGYQFICSIFIIQYINVGIFLSLFFLFLLRSFSIIIVKFIHAVAVYC